MLIHVEFNTIYHMKYVLHYEGTSWFIFWTGWNSWTYDVKLEPITLK